MDFIRIKTRISESIGKYKYVYIVMLAGVLLMMLPETKGKEEPVQQTNVQKEETTIQAQLENILSQIDGAGQVSVMLSISQGERIIYQTDSTYSQSDNSTDSQSQTILITDSQRNETGLVHQTNPPIYQGAIVLADGADRPSVKLAIVDAVSAVTGLGSDKITVLKLK